MRRVLLKLWRRRRLDDDLDAELAHHRDLAAAAGNPIPLGSTLRIKEASRDHWRFIRLEDGWRDLRYAARTLARQPGFTVFALVALVAGIGLNVAVFTVFNEMALRPWAVRDPGRVVRFDRPRLFSMPDIREMRRQARSFEGIVFETFHITQVAVDGRARMPQFVSGNYFELLGVEMALGRGLGTADDRLESPGAVVVLGYALWTAQYGRDPAIVGRQVRLNDVPFTVIGVAGPAFERSRLGTGDFWAPAASISMVDPKARELLDDETGCCRLVGRLASGVTRREAQAEVEVISGRLQSARGPFPTPERLRLVGTRPVDTIDTEFGPVGGPASGLVLTFLFVQTVTGAILLLACANVGNLMLARASVRHREIAVRMSLGASRWRVVRQLVAESLVLAVAAGALVLVVVFLWSSAAGVREPEIADGIRVTYAAWRIDARVMAYAAAVALLATIVSGLAPALQATRRGLMDAMKHQSAQATPRQPLRGVLLGVQVAISMTVLVCAALLARGVFTASRVETGFHSAGLSALSVTLPWERYHERGSRALLDVVRDRLQPAGPVGVTAVSLPRPLERITMTLPPAPNDPGRQVEVAEGVVDAGFFDVLRIPMASGRNFLPEDQGRRKVVINETMARRYWPGVNPVGRDIRYEVPRSVDDFVWDPGTGRVLERSDMVSHEIVGVVRDAHLTWPDPVEPTLFALHDGQDTTFTLIVPETAASLASDAIRQHEKEAAVSTASLSSLLEMRVATARGFMRIAWALGCLALLLATVGVYGVISFTVEQRRRELGIRMALGAGARTLVALVVRRNTAAILGGLAAGAALSLAASMVLESWLYGVSRLDPLAYGGVLALLAAAGVAASALPARRALRTNPSQVLQGD